MDAFLSLAPAALFALVWRFRQTMPKGSLWLAGSFAVATVGDLWATAANGAWYPSYVWLPIQLALAVRAVVPGKAWVSVWVWLGLLGLFDALTLTGPEVMVTGVGSVVVTSVAVHCAHRLAAPVLLYFGAGSIAYLGMVASIGGEHFMTWWWTYQACRVLGWLALAEIVRCCWFRYRVRRSTDDSNGAQFSVLRQLEAG